MLTNKKKLRRLERRASATVSAIAPVTAPVTDKTRAAQACVRKGAAVGVLTGAMLLGLPGLPSVPDMTGSAHAVELNSFDDGRFNWDMSTATPGNAQSFGTGLTGKPLVFATGDQHFTSSLQIAGANGHEVELKINANVTFDGKVSLNAAKGVDCGYLTIGAGKTFTAGGGLVIDGRGVVTLEGDSTGGVTLKGDVTVSPPAGAYIPFYIQGGTSTSQNVLTGTVAVNSGSLHVEDAYVTFEKSVTLGQSGVSNAFFDSANMDNHITLQQGLVIDGKDAGQSGSKLYLSAVKTEINGGIQVNKGSIEVSGSYYAAEATVDSITLAGAAAGDALLHVRGNLAVDRLNVGDAATHGAVEVMSDGVLSTGDLVLGTHGTVDLAFGGTLDVTGMANFAPELAADSYIDIHDGGVLKATSMTLDVAKLAGQRPHDTANGQLFVGYDSKLEVAQDLTLTQAGSAFSTGVDGLVKVGSLTLNDTDTPGSTASTLEWKSGTLTFTGSDTVSNSFLNNASGLTVNGSAAGVNLQADTAAKGGIFAGTVNVSSGMFRVETGDWSVNKLNVAGGLVQINDKLTISDINAGSLTQTGGSITVRAGGMLTAGKDVLLDNAYASTAGQFTVQGGGLLNIKGTGALDVADLKTAAGSLLTAGGAGLVAYTGTVSMTAGDLYDATVAGGSLNGIIKGSSSDVENSRILFNEQVAFDASSTVVTSGAGSLATAGDFGATSLLVAVPSDMTELTLNPTGNLTLTGGLPNSDLVNVTGATGVKTDITVAAGKGLFLGTAGTAAAQGGTLQGDVILNGNGAQLQALGGSYTVRDVVGSGTAGDGTVTVTAGGTLTAGHVGKDKAVNAVVENGGTLNAIQGDFADVDIDGGTIAVSPAAGAGTRSAVGTATVSGTLNMRNGVLRTSGDMNLSAATVGTLNAASLQAGGNIDASGKTLAAGADGLTIAAKELTVGSLDSIGDSRTAAGKLTATLTKLTTTGDVKLSHDSVVTVSGAGNVIGGDLSVHGGMYFTKGGATVTFDKDLTVRGDVGLSYNGVLTVGEFKTDTTARTITVAQSGSGTGSSFSIGKLTHDAANAAASTFHVYSYGNEKSFLHVQQLSGGVLNDAVIAGSGGMVSLGQHDRDWTKAQLKASATGASSTLVIDQSVTLGSTGKVLVGAGWDNTGQWRGAATANAVDVRGSSLLVVDVTAQSGQNGLKLNDANKKANIDSTAALRVFSDNIKQGQTYSVLHNVEELTQQDINKTLATGETLVFKGGQSTNSILVGLGDITFEPNGSATVTTTRKAASSVLPRISGSLAAVIENMHDIFGFDPHSGLAGVRFVSRALDVNYLGGSSTDYITATLEGAAQMGAVAGVQISTLGAANAASGAVLTRTSFAQPMLDMSKAVALHQDTDGALSIDSGLSAGNGMKNGVALWLMPLYQSNRTWGQKAGEFKTGMTSDLGGIALGADYTINDMFRFGAAFNVGGGYTQSSGDFNKTDNNFNFWGVSLYGGWTMNNFGISADVGYTSNYNKVQQDLPSAMQMGNLKADITSSALTAGLKGEYKFETSALDIIPHVGVRYMGLNTDRYDVKSGGTVFSVKDGFQNIWTFPVGVTLSKTITTDSGPSGWTFKPQMDLSVIPAAGDLDAKSTARIPGVFGDADMKMQVVDGVTFDGGVGLEVGKGDVSFGINYNIQASEHRTGQGVFGTLRYEF